MKKNPRRIAILLLVLTVSLVSAEENRVPISHRDACAKFSSSVVRIEAGRRSLGTGFIVSADGFILTAAHVVKDETGQPFSAIAVTLPDGNIAFAHLLPFTADSVGQDFAILKIEDKSNLPFLTLGTKNDVSPGSDAIIIGFPFSAITVQDKRISTKFCLSALIAASDLETVRVSGADQVGRPLRRDVKVDVIYFQGPSVKGISGSPIISRDTGHVVGIVTQKLTGIGQSLSDLKKETARGTGSGHKISGLDLGNTTNQILTVLDDQLANDLGAATGIDDPKHALTQAQRQQRNQKPPQPATQH